MSTVDLPAGPQLKAKAPVAAGLCRSPTHKTPGPVRVPFGSRSGSGSQAAQQPSRRPELPEPF